MARNFNGALHKIVLGGSITDGVFDVDTAWTYVVIVRPTTLTGGNRTICAKYSGAGGRQISLQFTGAGLIRILQNGSVYATGTFTFVINTWYIVGATCIGDGADGSIRCWAYEFDGTQRESGFAGGAVANSTPNDHVIEIGLADGNDPYIGDTAYHVYVGVEWGDSEFRAFAANPYRAFLAAAGGPFFLPLGLSSPEVDWSGNDNTGTVTSAVVADMPPVGPPFAHDTPTTIAAAAAALEEDPWQAPRPIDPDNVVSVW